MCISTVFQCVYDVYDVHIDGKERKGKDKGNLKSILMGRLAMYVPNRKLVCLGWFIVVCI